jgi:hypothetical protein
VFEIYTCRPVERAGGTPREQMKQLFVGLEATIRAPEFRGCPSTRAHPSSLISALRRQASASHDPC